MATYVPNATDATEPVASKTVVSAAEEFRTLKASVNAMRQWLGVHATAPATDTLGNALSTGDFYYNRIMRAIYVYTAGNWAKVNQFSEVTTGSGAGTVPLSGTTSDVLIFTPGGNISLTDSLVSGQSVLFLLTNPGIFTVTWPAGIKWLNGVTPTLLATGTTFVELIKISTTLYGVALGGAV